MRKAKFRRSWLNLIKMRGVEGEIVGIEEEGEIGILGVMIGMIEEVREMREMIEMREMKEIRKRVLIGIRGEKIGFKGEMIGFRKEKGGILIKKIALKKKMGKEEENGAIIDRLIEIIKIKRIFKKLREMKIILINDFTFFGNYWILFNKLILIFKIWVN